MDYIYQLPYMALITMVI